MSGRALLLATLGAAVLAPLAGCNGAEQVTEEGVTGSTSQTLAAAVAGNSEMGMAARALTATGLATVFDEAGSYTLLVPDDAAFKDQGIEAAELQSGENRPLVVAVMRDHILPGFLLPSDIGKAIDASAQGTVEMTTMGDRTLTFTREGEDIVVTGEDGSRAVLESPAVQGSNGVAIPVDGLLRKLDPAS